MNDEGNGILARLRAELTTDDPIHNGRVAFTIMGLWWGFGATVGFIVGRVLH